MDENGVKLLLNFYVHAMNSNRQVKEKLAHVKQIAVCRKRDSKSLCSPKRTWCRICEERYQELLLQLCTRVTLGRLTKCAKC